MQLWLSPSPFACFMSDIIQHVSLRFNVEVHIKNYGSNYFSCTKLNYELLSFLNSKFGRHEIA